MLKKPFFMRILIVTATEAEMKPLKEMDPGQHRLEFLISGIGMLETAFHLTHYLKDHEPDLIINTGLAGSFNRSLSIGEVVMVSEEIVSELGAEDGDRFLTTDEIGLKVTWKIQSTQPTALKGLKTVRSISVNTVHGNEASIQKVVQRLQPDIENMEGAAVFYVCKQMNIPCLELRAISNYVERRNKEAWNIPLALSSLKTAIQHVISEI